MHEHGEWPRVSVSVAGHRAGNSSLHPHTPHLTTRFPAALTAPRCCSPRAGALHNAPHGCAEIRAQPTQARSLCRTCSDKGWKPARRKARRGRAGPGRKGGAHGDRGRLGPRGSWGLYQQAAAGAGGVRETSTEPRAGMGPGTTVMGTVLQEGPGPPKSPATGVWRGPWPPQSPQYGPSYGAGQLPPGPVASPCPARAPWAVDVLPTRGQSQGTAECCQPRRRWPWLWGRAIVCQILGDRALCCLWAHADLERAVEQVREAARHQAKEGRAKGSL